jgi:hypothetical protein
MKTCVSTHRASDPYNQTSFIVTDLLRSTIEGHPNTPSFFFCVAIPQFNGEIWMKTSVSTHCASDPYNETSFVTDLLRSTIEVHPNTPSFFFCVGLLIP